MMALSLCLFLTCAGMGNGTPDTDPRLLLDMMESLQQPIEDFTCEFEGSVRHKGSVDKVQKLGPDGLYQSFSGRFVWSRGGDTRVECYHMLASNATIERETLVVRPHENQAERYFRNNDAPIGYSVIEKPDHANSWNTDGYGTIFLLDKLRRDVDPDGHNAVVSEETVDGRKLKVLSQSLRGRPDIPIFRYWIDLRRSGQVVRQEGYGVGGALAFRLDVELKSFHVGGKTVWMPVSGEKAGYADGTDMAHPISKTPTVLISTYIADGAIQFNRHPGRETFTMKHKPGTPISDHLRQIAYAFGQQKIDLKPSKAEAEAMLKQHLAEAQQQVSELTAAPPAPGQSWIAWLPWGFGAIVLASLLLLWRQRYGR